MGENSGLQSYRGGPGRHEALDPPYLYGGSQAENHPLQELCLPQDVR